MSNTFEEKTIASQSIYKGKIIDVRVDDVELPDGNKSKRELIDHPGAVGIIPVTDDHKIVMVEQYRKALEKSIIEIPAGKLEVGEQPEVTANRELEEETGYRAGSLDYVVSYYTSPGFANEKLYIYEARDLTKVDDALKGDDDEFVEIIEVTIDEALDLIKKEHIHDAKTIHAIYYLMQKEGRS
ncbi:NUDIX hydrolase [Tenuibacillus multivorans]|uniref:ADP-ribose pyrophosphatase n=1 Tax=Tenuibacillus multivorans TaxID=237069 RepID=A0A1H0D105_9BACI|nr:NUDIX hydrolase [Tenuibacillus multivorans]GEL76090.1 ADP-ribose pyrophosphatase [Tenuibacillus multivorans]SDN63726.1 ADP-ribose pyrophosphatase [Tenuibacillus multivorans]